MSRLSPSWLLRIEAAAVLAVVIGLYARHDGSWLPFAILILAPDLSALGYLVNTRVGALSYNLAHAFIAPAVLVFIGFAGSSLATSLALIWAAHIAGDRVLGYGLKYEEGFKITHLQRI